MKRVFYNIIFVTLDVIIFIVLNLQSQDHWIFKFFLFLWTSMLLAAFFSIGYIIKTYFSSVSLFFNLVLTCVITFFVATIFVASLSAERISFFSKILSFYKDKENFEYLTVPYILSGVFTLVLYLVVNRNVKIKGN